MTSWANNLNGIASGTTPTAGNSGGVSGTAFGLVLAPSGGSITSQSAAAFEGATGLRIVWPAAAASGYVAWASLGIAQGTRLSGSFWYRFTATPAVTDILYNDAASSVRLTSAGAITIVDAGGTQRATTTAIAANTWVFVQHAVTAGSSTGNGRVELRVTTQAGALLVNYDSGSTVNTGTASIATAYHGRNSSTGMASFNAYTADYDLLALDNTLTGGTFPGTAPAVVTGGNIKVYNGSAWVAKPVKVWTGTVWKVAVVKRWTGSAWATTTY